jgi:hypothetical protein
MSSSSILLCSADLAPPDWINEGRGGSPEDLFLLALAPPEDWLPPVAWDELAWVWEGGSFLWALVGTGADFASVRDAGRSVRDADLSVLDAGRSVLDAERERDDIGGTW